MNWKLLHNQVSTTKNSLAGYKCYKTDLLLTKLSIWSITFVGLNKCSKSPEKESCHIKFDGLFLVLEVTAIECEKLPWNWRFPAKMFRRNIAKECYGRMNRTLRCFYQTEEHLWDIEQLSIRWKSLCRYLSSKVGVALHCLGLLWCW